ncbi:MAG: metallophosphoesterase family protein [Pontibacterium sp.]
MNKVYDLGDLQGTVLLFGGPYSNLAATRAVQTEATRLGIKPENIICTGDLVAYCAEPRQTVELIRDWGIRVVMGNCEESLANNAPDCGCGFDENSACSLLSADWYAYASQQVSDLQKQWMATLPRAIRFNLQNRSFQVIHGGVKQINEFVFASGPLSGKVHQQQVANVDVIIGGHCGLPFGQLLSEGAWLNAGVIGMPANDGTEDGWYMLLTPEQASEPDQENVSIRVTWHRLSYAAAESHQTMQSAGLNTGYAEALLSGCWPSLDILPDAETQVTGQPLSIPVMVL